MYKRFIVAFALLISSPLVACSTEYQPITETVTYVIDGDTFVTGTGKKVRLLNINTPETAKNGKPGQPYAQKAKTELTKLVLNKEVTLKFQKRLKDKYKRLLAEVYLNDGTWVNKRLVEAGLAHVYTFPDNAINAEPLLKAENIARENQINMWSHPRWKLLDADNIPDSSVGNFNIVKGVVSNIVKVKGKYYINFGNDWRTDFTAEISLKNASKFKRLGNKIENLYRGKTLLVRGFIKPVNGYLITITHPEQLTVLK